MTSYYDQAVKTLTQAARAEHDFAGVLAAILADVAGNLGSSDAITAGRPGSWEASLVDQLVKGTVGYDDAYLPGPARGRKLTDAKARQIRDAALYGEMTHKEIGAEFGVSPGTVWDIATGRTWGWLK